MAGTFYTLQEVIEKLGKDEQQIKDMIKEGKLREYRDGSRVLFKQDDVDILKDEPGGLEIKADGEDEFELELEETAGIMLEPAEKDSEAKPAPKPGESEGGFGLSQMGELTMGDTKAGTLGINVLGETDDQYKITSDTSAETKAVEAAEGEEIESLDADSSLESFGSGSGLLDLSLQADDTSLGAVLDDILPTGPEAAEAGAAEEAPIGLVDEAEGLMSPAAEMAPAAAQMAEEAGQAGISAPVMVVVPMDPATAVYGVAMFLPLAAIILAGLATLAAVRGVLPGLVKTLVFTGIADISLIWYVAIGLVVVMLIILAIAALSGGKKSKKRP